MARFILVGADPNTASSHHGGVMTLSRGLVEYVCKHGHTVAIIDTLRVDFNELTLWQRLRAGLGRVRQMITTLRAGRYDGAIILSGAGLSFYERVTLARICRWYGVNNVFLIVDGWFLDLPKTARVRRRLRRWLLRIPRKLASTGQRWSDLFAELGVQAERIVPIHYWLSDSVPVATAPRRVAEMGPVHFVFVGWMIKEKGVNELLASIEELRKRHRFSVTLVGGGTMLEQVRQRIHDAGWGPDVAALGWVPTDRLAAALAGADVFVLPSYAEGFPMSLLEAFSKGIPAICTDVGGVSDSLKDGVNGFLIPPRQVGPLVDAMERYIRNPSIITEQSRAALETVRANHDAEVNCARILAALS